jgi:long-chain acyl-CoA synthetase
VVLKDGAAANGREVRRELIEFCRSRLASYKVPRRIRVVDSLPKSSVGKALRREIRNAEMARAGEEE